MSAANHTQAAEHGVEFTDHRVLVLGFAIIALLLALTLGWQQVRDLDVPGSTARALAFDLPMTTVSAGSAEQLADELDALDYAWPPEDTVPRIRVEQFPGDINELDADTRKAVFFRSLLPLVMHENAALRHHRAEVESLLARNPLPAPGSGERDYLGQVKERFRVEGDLSEPSVRNTLLRRLDEIPASLALAQAANESGWGTSRFTREANNLFGEWTWQEDQGMLPARRAEGATHLVRIFPDLYASVRSYIHNINIGHAYSDLRHTRANLRAQGEPLDGLELAGGLLRYSERGQAYVDEVRSMIRQNGLHRMPDLELATSAP